MRRPTILFLLLFCVNSMAQNQSASDVSLLNKASLFIKNSQYDSAYIYSKAYYDKIKSTSNDTLIINALIQLVEITDYVNKKEQSNYFQEADKKAKAIDYKEKLVELYFTQGEYYFKNQDFVEAIPYFVQIDSISKNFNIRNETTIDAMLRRAEISKLSFTYETTNLAHSLLLDALKISKEINAVESENVTYLQLADINQMVRDFKETKKYIDLSLAYFKKQNNAQKVARALLIKTAYYMGVDSLDRSEQTHIEMISYLNDEKFALDKANAIYYYGNFLIRKKSDYKKAIGQLESAKTLFQKIGKDSIEIYHRTIRDLAYSNIELGNYKEASMYFKDAYDLKIELLEKFNRSNSKNLEAKYQTENKEQEIALLKSENELIEQTRKNQRNTLLGGLAITSIAGLFLSVMYRNRRKTTQKLQELDTFKSKFFANISHEFRTPLTLISGPIDKRLNEGKLNDEDRSEFQMIQRNSNRLLNLVNQLLDLSKLESGHLKLNVGQGDLTLLLKAITSSFQYISNQKNINYTINIADINNAWFDKDVIEKIVSNLLSNAFKYTPEGGYVTCSASVVENSLEFCVENNSKQFSKTQIENIFNRFYQVDENTEGVGIGLSLVKELVTLSHGDILVENKTENSIVFNVSLPLHKEQFKPNEIVEGNYNPSIIETKSLMMEPENSSEQTIDEDLPILLIVDDQEDIRNFIKSAFKNNYQVVEASNGEIGVDKAIELIPDIIISDVMMPILNGFKLTEKLKQDQRTCHIPIILLTAKADDADKFIGLETGADDYIVKPFKIKGLETRVKNLISSRAKLRERYSQEIILKPKDIAITNFDEQFLEKIQNVLEQKLTESSFSIEEFSKTVGMSRMQLHRKLKALTGLSATEFIRSQRLKLAADLLKKSDANVSQIGYTVGFNDPSYFAKCFKEAYKCTPTAYSKKHA